MPACKQRSISIAIALAVIATMGKLCHRGLARICSVAVIPSMTGICISISTRSKSACSNLSSAS
ncbi:Uncharacterised protein [Vibrio cholerae]|nr:Uncharacterised protein [Vibrio cholerae]